MRFILLSACGAAAIMAGGDISGPLAWAIAVVLCGGCAAGLMLGIAATDEGD